MWHFTTSFSQNVVHGRYSIRSFILLSIIYSWSYYRLPFANRNVNFLKDYIHRTGRLGYTVHAQEFSAVILSIQRDKNLGRPKYVGMLTRPSYIPVQRRQRNESHTTNVGLYHSDRDPKVYILKTGLTEHFHILPGPTPKRKSHNQCRPIPQRHRSQIVLGEKCFWKKL